MPKLQPDEIETKCFERLHKAITAMNSNLGFVIKSAQECSHNHPDSTRSMSFRQRVEGDELKVDPHKLYLWLCGLQKKMDDGDKLTNTQKRAIKKFAFVLIEIIGEINLIFSLKSLNESARELIAATFDVGIGRRDFSPFTKMQIKVSESVRFIVHAAKESLLEPTRKTAAEIALEEALKPSEEKVAGANRCHPRLEQGLLFRLPEPQRAR